jgi:hypothetical protein
LELSKKTENVAAFVVRSNTRQHLMALGSILRDRIHILNEAFYDSPIKVTPILSLKSGSPLRRYLYRNSTQKPIAFAPLPENIFDQLLREDFDEQQFLEGPNFFAI